MNLEAHILNWAHIEFTPCVRASKCNTLLRLELVHPADMAAIHCWAAKCWVLDGCGSIVQISEVLN